ncbi:MAG: hypothetical protein ACE37F_21035 [Nannocystaceae bacterium]|nr:hypothetical protein [bacterium]
MRPLNFSVVALLSLSLGACDNPSPSSGSTTSAGTTGSSAAESSSSGAPSTSAPTSSNTGPSGTSSTLPPGDGCCAVHEGPGCNEAAVQSCVCDMDASCCGFDWGESCVDIAQARCEATCQPDMTTSDSDSTGGPTTGVTTASTTGFGSTGFGTTFGDTEFGTTGDFGEALCCYEGFGCDHIPTEQCVCDLDPSCCEGEWGPECVTLATNSCNACTSDDCCTPQTDAGCSDMSIQECVCAFDDYCCENEWDYICADAAVDECRASCG